MPATAPNYTTSRRISQDDLGKTRDLADDPDYQNVLAGCEGRLRSICDPDVVNRRAFRGQVALTFNDALRWW